MKTEKEILEMIEWLKARSEECEKPEYKITFDSQKNALEWVLEVKK
jgi:hypothetical protein